MEKSPVTLGSVYMDNGEGLDYMESQILRMAKMKPEFYFIDFICSENQVNEATKLVAQFYMLIAEHLPYLPMSNVFTAITCDDGIRPTAMAVAVMTGNDYKVVDLNPERKGR